MGDREGKGREKRGSGGREERGGEKGRWEGIDPPSLSEILNTPLKSSDMLALYK